MSLSTSSLPLVSIISPVYNGSRYLAQCIESVLAQTYTHWEYVVVDNCSTDGSRQLAESYAARAPRVRVVRNSRHLPAVANWNHAAGLAAAAARYLIVLHADDYLLPECLAKKIMLAESHPRVSAVSSLVLREKTWAGSSRVEKTVVNQEWARSAPALSGTALSRDVLLGRIPLACSPASLLLRWDQASRRGPLYDESTGVRAALDRQVLFEILQNADFGFVPEVLTGIREHAGSITSTAWHGASYGEKLQMLRSFRSHYLSDDEFREGWERELAEYYTFLGRNVFLLRGLAFWRLHGQRLRALNAPLRFWRLATTAGAEAARAAARPLTRWRNKPLAAVPPTVLPVGHGPRGNH